jgi:hypothetical protein
MCSMLYSQRGLPNVANCNTAKKREQNTRRSILGFRRYCVVLLADRRNGTDAISPASHQIRSLQRFPVESSFR